MRTASTRVEMTERRRMGNRLPRDSDEEGPRKKSYGRTAGQEGATAHPTRCPVW